MRALDYAAGLLVMARKDFDALRGMVGNPLFADEIFGFHAQQAIEKMLKAWLAARGIAFPLTHDLSRLFELLEKMVLMLVCSGRWFNIPSSRYRRAMKPV
jgi:hypothetical protein